MKAKRISIVNYMGIPDLDFAAGSVNILSGKNGVGKTSVLEAIKHVMTHDHDPKRIGPNGDRAEVTIWMDNGESYRMTTKVKGTTWDFKDTDGRPITRSKEHIQSIIDFLSLDPVEFISLEPKDQRNKFLE